MDYTSMEWLVTLFSVHFLGLVTVLYLLKGAPCWLQRLSIMLLILAFVVFCAAYFSAILRWDEWWRLLIVAGVFEHLAVLVYVFRMWWQIEEKKWKSSINSQNL